MPIWTMICNHKTEIDVQWIHFDLKFSLPASTVRSISTHKQLIGFSQNPFHIHYIQQKELQK